MIQSIMSLSDKNINIFNNYCSYINKLVLLETVRTSHVGYIRCIDPLTQSVVIVTKPNNAIIAMSHSIKSITICDQNDNEFNDDNSVIDIKQFLRLMGEQTETECETSSDSLTEQQLSERKSMVVEWLSRNRVPVEQLTDGSLVVAYALILSEPYTRNDCICSNEIVLSKIQSLLESMPQTFA